MVACGPDMAHAGQTHPGFAKAKNIPILNDTACDVIGFDTPAINHIYFSPATIFLNVTTKMPLNFLCYNANSLFMLPYLEHVPILNKL